MSALSVLFDRAQVSLWDIVDILIVSILIYEALKLIRGTRAMQMAIGSVLVILLLYISQAFPLRTVGWLIRNVLTYAVFAAIVLFQSDIRRALSHLGRAPFFRYFGRSERAAETIEEVVTAAAMLAKARVGAIMVFEREIGLRNYVESGIPLDAAVSYDLLTTIFQPTTPMHDGAVIISEERIAAAACFLPLTVNPQLDRDLGTRHRAAIGLTEECDAVAVIVSEERGEISLAARPDRTRPDARRDAGAAAVAAVAAAHGGRRAIPPGAGRLMAWHPFRNVGLKIAALALGTALWFTVSGHQVERRIPVPVFYRNVPQGLELTGEQADQVNVHLRGGDTIISSLGQNQVFVIVDLGAGREGVNVISLRTEQVAAPMGLSVLQVDPNSVTVTLEPSDNKRTYVDRVIEFRNTNKGAQIDAEPPAAAIVARGPAASLRSLSPLSVVPYVDVSGRAPGQYNLPVRVDLPGLTVLEIKPATVLVRIR